MQTQSKTQGWLSYFKANAPRLLPVTAGPRTITEQEKQRISASIQKFQIGEASEGKCLRAKAEAFAAREGDPDYAQAIQYLIKEENRHSAYLGNFMRDNGIPKAKGTWTDGMFRWVRNLANLETSIRVLVSAELIALAYYRCLGKATGCRKLARICQRMLEEETEHVKFQMTTIHRINRRKFPLFAAWADIGHALLLFATIHVVWAEHKPVLETEYASCAEFRRNVWDLFQENMDYGCLAAEKIGGAR